MTSRLGTVRRVLYIRVQVCVMLSVMLRLPTRMLARRRAFALVAMLVLVWCQIVASAHATSMVGMDGMDGPAEMAAMVGCDGLPDTDGDDASDCPTEDATPDSGKLPVFAPLPPVQAFALARAQVSGSVGLARYELPQGRAPPRSRLCCWLI